VNQFKSRVKDRGSTLTLPKLKVEGAIHVLDVFAVAHHREIPVFAFYHQRFHRLILYRV